jgi:hypothetical protein
MVCGRRVRTWLASKSRLDPLAKALEENVQRRNEEDADERRRRHDAHLNSDGCCADATDERRSKQKNQIFARAAMGTSRPSIGSSLWFEFQLALICVKGGRDANGLPLDLA